MEKRTTLYRRGRQVMLLALVGVGTGLSAQPICSIDLGADHTICEGQTVQLQAPMGFNSYLWNTGANTPSITVGTSGVYTCQVSYPSGQLVTNGNFTAGNTGFSSQFLYNSTLTAEGNYFIGTNAALYHPQFSGVGTGNFLMANAGWGSYSAGQRDVWCQDVTICPGQTYTLSYRTRTLSNATPARLQWWINGVGYGPEVTLPVQALGWQVATYNWTAPGNAPTTTTICLRVMSGDGVGNDFGLDDISMQGTVVLSDNVTVNVTPLPVVDLGNDATLCTGQNLVLDAGVPGGTYLWQDGTTLSSYVVSGPGIYSVEVTANNCTSTDAITVNYNPSPVVDLGPDVTLCTGQTLTLNVAQPGASYGWQNGSTSPTFTVNAPGTYSVNVFLNGCVSNDAIDVAYNTTPTVNLGPDVTICAGATTTFNVTTPGATYLWNTGATTPTLTTGTAGPYNVAVTVNGCTGTDAANVAVTPLPVFDLGPDQTVCPGTAVTLNATVPGGSYAWSTGATTPTLSASAPGNFSVTVTANGCQATDAMTLSNYTLPVFDLGLDRTICAGQNTSFNVNVAGATYLWSNGSTGGSLTASTAGWVWVDVTTNGCTVRDSVLVNVNPLPTPDLGPDVPVCPGNTTVLNATLPGASYLWNTGAVTPTLTVGPGAYSVQVTVNGCSVTDAITVGSFPAAAVNLGNDTTLCPGQQLTLNVNQAGATYLWQDGSSGAIYPVSAAGTYSVTLTTANGCNATDAINVGYASPQAVELGPNITLCQGQQTVLNATVPGATYLWNTGATTPTLTVGTSGNYSVIVTQGNCTVTDAVTVTVLPLPVVDLGPDQTLCPGAITTLNAFVAGATYLWNTGAQTASITVPQGGTYSVTVTGANGCTASDAVTVVEANPGAIELGAPVSLCQGQSVTLNATLPGATYLWNTGATTALLNVNSAGTYWVTADQGGCTVSDTVVVNVQPIPTVELGPSQTLCLGQSTVLNATNAGATYLWSTGATTPTITVSTTGNYSVTVDLNGCTATDAVAINVLTPSSVNLGADLTLCAGNTATLNATTPGSTYLWSTGATTPTLTVGTTGTYWVQLTQSGCTASDTVNVNVLPSPSVELGPAQTLCLGQSTVLNATNAGATYLWSTGATTPTITVSTTGNYGVTVDLNGCTATDAVAINVLTPSSVNLGADVELCAGTNTTFNATTAGATYLWSTGVTTPTLTTGTAGTYWVQVTQSGCSAGDTVQVSVIDPGTIELGPAITACAGNSITLDATLPGASYAWSTGATSATITVNTSGIYSVAAVVNGCPVTDAVSVTFNPLPTIDLGVDQSICPGASAFFDASTPNATYLWHDGSTQPTYTASSAGNVSVTVTVAGCASSDGAAVIDLPAPVAELGPDMTICAGDALTLNVTQAGATYLWNDGVTTGSRDVTSAGTYSVTVDLNGCTASDAVTINVTDLTAIELGADRRLCPGESTTLTAQAPGANTTWSTGATTGSITVSTAGTYSVTVQNGACVVTDAVNVSIVPLVQPALGADQMVCEGDTVALSVAPGAASVAWNTGSTAASIEATTSGNYSVTLSLEGCTASDVVRITFLPTEPEVDLGPDRLLCPNQTMELDVTGLGTTYLWNTGSTEPRIRVTEPGTYWVTIFTQCGLGSDTLVIEEGYCGPLVHVPNAFSPNNDQINDEFLVVIDGALNLYELFIFNRWGEVIFSSTTPGEAWNGTAQGTVVQDGVYVYKLRYRALSDVGVKAEERIGHVTVIR
jgi:gliding motility-associated-like protein